MFDGGDIYEQDASSGTLAAASPFAATQNMLSTSGSASAPEVADDSNGDTAVIWADGASALATYRPSGNSSFNSNTTLGTVDASTQPQIAITSNDDPIALWQDGDTIQAETADSSGTFSGSATQISGSDATEPSLAVDNNGDAVAAWIQSDGTNLIATADGYDSGAGPANNNLHIAAAGSAGTGLTFFAQPYDVWPAISQSSISWNFGDGTSVQTGDDVTHTFAHGGDYTVSLTTTNADGNQTTSSQQIDVAASAPTVPAGGLAQLPSPDDCVTSNVVGCGTLIPYGLNVSYQPIVSPDGKNVYAVGFFGGIVEFSRNSSTGALTEIGCVTSDATDCSGSGSIQNAEGISNPAAIAISPDGSSVYVVDQGDNSITTFTRNASNGLLTEQNGSCYSSSGASGCTSDPGTQNPWSVAVSPDGKNVYVSSGTGQDIAEFTRNTSTGAITPIAGNNCISDAANPNGCQVATGGGLLNVVGVDVSPDGDNVYATAGGVGDNGDVAEFTRNGSTGALAPIPGNACIGRPGAPAECLTSATAINGSEDMTINSSGTFAYVNSFSDDAIVQLRRAASTGALTQVGCIGTSSSPAGLCATSNAKGIDGPLGVALSPDGLNLYASGAEDNAEAAFSVDPTTGVLTQLASPNNCITSDPSGNSHGCGATDATGLAGPRRLAVSPDGKNVYVANQGSGGLAELARTVPSSPPPPPPTGQVTNGGEASWDTGSTATSASATVTVPAVSCGSIAAGTYAGQSAGVELFGQVTIGATTFYPAEAADVRTYCDGSKAEYETSFAVDDETSGTRVFHPAGLTVSPGDPLAISTTATSSGAGMQITDVNTGKTASITGPGYAATGGADIGVQPITSNGHGAPMLTGSQSATATTDTIGGPVQSSPVVVQNALVDGQPISSSSTFYGLRWVNSSKTVVATPSAVSGDDFAVDFASVPTPVAAKSGDAAPVSGKVLIELPGTHKFVPLNSVKQIPNGTLVNATNGSVQITVKLPNGQTQTGVFFGGEFQFEQSKSGEVTAVLAGGSFKGCPKPAPAKKTKPKKKKRKAPDAGAASFSRHHPVRHLWSNAHGSFSTQGKYGAAAVRGTEWLTQDQCNGTFFKVTRDEITVTSFKLNNHKTTVKQGHSFLSPA